MLPGHMDRLSGGMGGMCNFQNLINLLWNRNWLVVEWGVCIYLKFGSILICNPEINTDGPGNEMGFGMLPQSYPLPIPFHPGII